MICLVLNGNSFAENHLLLDQEAAYAGLLEYRLDLIEGFGPSMVNETIAFLGQSFAKTGLGGILTIRLPADGGKWASDLVQREMIFESLVSASVPGAIKYIDLEIGLEADKLAGLCRDRNIEIIRSSHNFSLTPDLDTFKKLASDLAQGEIFKFAVMTNSTGDLYKLYEAAQSFKNRRVVLLGMGEFGTPSRILYKKFGSLWTYASIKPPSSQSLAAPGQLDPKILANLYRANTIGPKTRLFGIFGDPISHSKSPQFHNERFISDGLDAVYVPIRVDDLEAARALVEALDFGGLSVTIPHKEAIISWASQFEGGVQKIGASNTLIRKNGQWLATNTDTKGFYEPLVGAMKALPAFDKAGPKRALVLGAGGAARACVYELVQNGFELVIANRTRSRAEELALCMGSSKGVGLDASEIRKAQTGPFCLMVNTTSMGMGHEEPNQPALDLPFDGVALAYDIVYTPPLTPFLKAAQDLGIAILNGQEMFQKQAEAQYKLFCSVMN